MGVPAVSDPGRARAAWERRQAARRRRNILGFGILSVITLIVLLVTLGSGGAGPTRHGSSSSGGGGSAGGTGVAGGDADPPRPAGPPAVESGVMPWQLAAPISREVVLPSSSTGRLVIAGGIGAGGSSDSGIYTLAVADGGLDQVGRLPAAGHDAAGGWAGGSAIFAGGGDTTVRATTARFPRGGGNATAAASLPQPRADCSGVTIGSTFYVVGGYDGSSPDPSVLSTADGRAWQRVADLPVPVRYAAVAALAGRIWVFGGLSASGSPVDTVQVVDPAKRSASVVGHLPLPLAGAAASEVGGYVVLAGGQTGTGSSKHAVGGIWELDPSNGHLLAAGRLAVPVAYGGTAVAGGTAYLVGGETTDGTPTAAVQMLRPAPAFGVAGYPGAGSPYYGYQLLVADRGNNRLLLIDDTGRVIWTYPSPSRRPPPGGFYYPDDAFFVDHGKEIITNQEDNETITLLAYPSGKVLWTYGHPRRTGSAPGYLDNPDDTYVMRDGTITSADTVNCRVIVLDPKTHRILHQIGAGPNSCTHNPPHQLGSPNGDTPLADGNLLISEINGSWVDEYTTAGRLVWSAQLAAVGYPSDPQQIGPDKYLIADYSTPGAIVEFDRAGHVLYRYAPRSGPGMLDRPSLVELLPSGVFMANDDYNDRMVAVDPSTGAVVWQYGVTGHAGTAPGLLSIPDGFDIVGPGGTTPTHTATG